MPPAAYKDLVLDATDAMRLGRFWAPALGLAPEELADGDVVLRGPTPQHGVWIDTVPEPRTVKNRMHLDVYTRSLDDLYALGATLVGTFPDWTVMADPEGGEFCAFVRDDPPPYRLYEVALDAVDPRVVAPWWAAMLGGSVEDGDGFLSVADIPGAPFATLDVVAVPEPKRAKNRVHLDVVGDVAALVAHGATVLAEHPRWTVLADPEGNEFCAFPPS